MILEIKLFSYFRDGIGKETTLDISEGETARGVVERLGLDTSSVGHIIVNDIDVSLDYEFVVGDKLTLFPLSAGG